MPRIDPETVNKILDAADIVDVVSDFVKLKRSGANYKGLCPFHNERTPSFSVNRARNICKCFSCGKGGSPVNFIMEHEQLSYQEALRYLARKYNIEIVEKELTDEERAAQNTREAMLAVNEFALSHFEKNLLSTDEGRDLALAYLRHRGISDAMIERFHLGYAIDRGNELIGAATNAGFKERYLVDTGLAVESERDGHRSCYDRFRGRVIFPIHSISGRVIAFGGRTMRTDKSIAKYVNSPESAVYKKNLELYGLYQAKSSIARKDRVILVEGYLDVVSMHQAGIDNVVASSGTSLTEGQIRALRRFTTNVTLIYDADPAGIKASLRGINLLLGEGLNVKVLLLPPGEDPDSFAQSHMPAEVERYLAENQVDVIAFMADIMMREVSPSDPTAKARVINEILRTVAYVDDPVTLQEYISGLSRILSVPEDVLLGQLRLFRAKRHEEDAKSAQRARARESIGVAATAGEAVAESVEKAADDAPLLELDANRLRPYEEMLIRYIVRYGLLYITDIADEDGNIRPGTVFDLIDSELSLDGLTMTYGPYARTYEAVKALRNGAWAADRARHIEETEAECARRMEQARENIRNTAGSISQAEAMEREAMIATERFKTQSINEFDAGYCQLHLANSAEDDVRTTANSLLVERYTLSRIYTKQENVETEQDQLHILVPRAIFELRNAILSDMLSGLSRQLAELKPEQVDEALEIMKKIGEYKELQRELVKILGERIILPRP